MTSNAQVFGKRGNGERGNFREVTMFNNAAQLTQY